VAGSTSRRTRPICHEVYDPATNSWSVGAAAPAARSSLAVAYYNGLILVVGGETTTGSQTDTDGFDVEGEPLGQARAYARRAARNCRRGCRRRGLFCGGAQGVGGNGTSDQVFAFRRP